MRQGRPSKETPQDCGVIAADAARAFGVSTRSVETAKRVADKGDKAVVDAVKSGTITVSAAAKLVDAVPDKRKRRRIVKSGKKSVAAAMQNKRKRDAEPRTEVIVYTAELRQQIESLPAQTNNAVAYIREALADGGLHPAHELAGNVLSWTPQQLNAAYVNASPSPSERTQRLEKINPLFDPTTEGRRIIDATLGALLWLGVVIQDGEGVASAAYRLVGRVVRDDASGAASPARPWRRACRSLR